MRPSGLETPHEEHVVDRPDVEAPRGVEPTGTNGEKAITHPPIRLGGRHALREPPGTTLNRSNGSQNVNTFASAVRSPNRHGSIPHPLIGGMSN